MDGLDLEIAEALEEARVIALVGASPDPARASHGVGRFLRARGYRVIPVNPRALGETIFGEPVRPRLEDVPEADFIDIFRRSEAVPAIVETALTLPRVRTIWMQLGVRHPEAAARARAAGLRVIEDRCPKIEIARLRLPP